MKLNKILILWILALFMGLSSCSSDDSEIDPTDDVTGQPDPDPEPQPDNPEPIDLSAYDNGSRVMMQAFYWDVEPRFEWWTNLTDKVGGWADAGINRLWLPVATKGQSGGYSMGYDVSDYYDFGNYNQHGTTETRFGSREELEELISTAHQNDVEVIADIVINHNSGGGLEYNPYRGYETYTLFDEEHGNASGMFNRNYEYFYPNSVSQYDPGSLFYAESNLDHHREYVQDWLWKKDNSVAKYYKNVMGFDGWRFDYVLGFEPWVVKAWLDEVGGFSVAELWDGRASVLRDYVNETGSGAFDFATFYKLEEGLDRFEDLNTLDQDMLWKTHPEKAVTFTANHDTEKDSNEDNFIKSSNKMKAYAYILTHPGYPTIFYSDYENTDFQDEIKNLIEIHNSIATGDTEILYIDEDEYVMKRAGTGTNPGLILYISISNSTKRRSVSSNWNNVTLMDYSGNSTYNPTSDENGAVTIEAPSNGYSIWSITE
ncbi:alpha-amylase [Gramella sp. GC03-9]|uniref:Alpha-amylase n=1 Tax=Christiangramia oceanisediminis TaxID=2920386 RepID=A0A9X2KZ95_9FLAO|nr:alpha-amylase [Gramella oceanisediminis]MCP9200959.1 alpha-amylase [Gramella oceanisediminis]